MTTSWCINLAVKKVTKRTVCPAIKIAATLAIMPGILRAADARREAATAFISIATISSSTPPSRSVSAIEASTRIVWSQTVASQKGALGRQHLLRIIISAGTKNSRCCSRIRRTWPSAWIRSNRRDFWTRIPPLIITIIAMERAIILKRQAVQFKAMPRLQFYLRKRKGWAAVTESKINRLFVVKIVIRDNLTPQLSFHLHSSLIKRLMP